MRIVSIPGGPIEEFELGGGGADWENLVGGRVAERFGGTLTVSVLGAKVWLTLRSRDRPVRKVADKERAIRAGRG